MPPVKSKGQSGIPVPRQHVRFVWVTPEGDPEVIGEASLSDAELSDPKAVPPRADLFWASGSSCDHYIGGQLYYPDEVPRIEDPNVPNLGVQFAAMNGKALIRTRSGHYVCIQTRAIHVPLNERGGLDLARKVIIS